MWGKKRKNRLLRFEIPPLWEDKIILNFKNSRAFIDLVLSGKDELVSGRFVLVEDNKIRREFNTENNTLKIRKRK